MARAVIGYSDSENGHDKSPTIIPERFLQQYYRPSFQAAFDAGCATVMNAYTDINGLPMASSRQYLTDLLRDEMGFEGMVVTDWAEIKNQFSWHKVVDSYRGTAKVALQQTTIDMSMVPTNPNLFVWGEAVNELAAAGEVEEERLTVSAGRVLQLKKDLGLFADPMLDASRGLPVGTDADRRVALDMAADSLVLLRNEPVEIWGTKEDGTPASALPLPSVDSPGAPPPFLPPRRRGGARGRAALSAAGGGRREAGAVDRAVRGLAQAALTSSRDGGSARVLAGALQV